ncbi:MAG: hypothetical protein CMJ64_15615 [Planctomycetaceae bacterium]|nr:hypothetical protein [Planctomycetaceae bacterium]
MRAAEDEFACDHGSRKRELQNISQRPTSNNNSLPWPNGSLVRVDRSRLRANLGFVVRALDDGGMIYESEDCMSLNDAMAALETGLASWFEDSA